MACNFFLGVFRHVTGPFPKFGNPQGQPIQSDGLDTDLKGFGQMLVGQERILVQKLLKPLLACLLLCCRTHSITYF